MDNLWAPWRTPYILGQLEPETGCIFCNRIDTPATRENLVLRKDENVLVMMNRFPYNNGHLMVVPFKHVGDPMLLSADEWNDLNQMVRTTVQIVQQTMNPDGANVGINLGHAAGAGIADHLHIHVVPRWVGDTNFMPAVGATKVISQSLDACYDTLRPTFDRLGR